MKILDVNVLIYLSDPTDERHAPVREYIDRALASSEVVGLPWLTIVGFLRIVTRRIAGRSLVSRELAEQFVSRLLAHPNVVLVSPGPRHWSILGELTAAGDVRGDLYPNAHLAALAVENGAEVVSSDTDFARFPRLKWTDPTRPQ